MPPKRSVRIDEKNKRKMEEVKEEPSSAAVSQQRVTMPANFLPLQPPHKKFRPPQSSFNFNSQQQKQPPTQPDNGVLLRRPFTNFTALSTEEDNHDCVPGPIRRMYDCIDQVTESHSGQVKNMLIDVYMRHFNGLASIANKEAGKKLVEKEEELRQAKIKLMELEKKVNQLTNQGRKLQTKVTSLEMRCAVLDSRLYAQQQQESIESSHVDSHVMEPPPSAVEPPPSVGNYQACFKTNAASIMCFCPLCLPSL